MKTLKQFMSEAETSDETIAEFNKLIPKYDAMLKKMFPSDWQVSIRLTKILGMNLTTSVASPWKVTRHNANVLIETMAHLEDDKFEAEKLMIPRVFKYRKIKAKSPEELLKKLVAWHRKKKDEIMEFGKQK